MALSLFAVGSLEATQQDLGSSRPGVLLCLGFSWNGTDSASSLLLAHGGLAPHQHGAVTRQCEAVLGLQCLNGAAAVPPPRTLLANVVGDDLVEGAVARLEGLLAGANADLLRFSEPSTMPRSCSLPRSNWGLRASEI
jgi:hypothetical protein